MAEVTLSEGVKQLQGHKSLLIAVLWIWLFFTIAVLGIEIAEFSGYDIEADGTPTIALGYIGAGFGNLLSWFICVVIFSIWTYRAAANIQLAEVPGFNYTPGWAVGWFFIPFANLIKPFQAMRQIWNASHGAAGELDDGEGLLTTWWGIWLFTNITANISLRISLEASDPEVIRMGMTLGLVSSIASVALFFVVVRMIREITSAQESHLQSYV